MKTSQSEASPVIVLGHTPKVVAAGLTEIHERDQQTYKLGDRTSLSWS